MTCLTENRQPIRIKILILILFGGFYLQHGFSQEQKSKIDYSIKSNILDPDTLKGDQKTIFWHPYFLKLSSKETENLEPSKIKTEFAKLGITTNQRARFVAALTFYDVPMICHKKSCEQWESFKDLAPKSD